MRFLFGCFTIIKFQGGWSLTRHVNNLFLSSPSWSIILCLWSTYFLRQSVQKGRLFEYTTKFNLLDTSLLETVQSSTSTTHQTHWEIRMVVWRNEVWFRIRGVKTIHLYKRATNTQDKFCTRQGSNFVTPVTLVLKLKHTFHINHNSWSSTVPILKNQEKLHTCVC